MAKLKKLNKGYNNENNKYWDRKSPEVMGDIRQRPELIKFIGEIKNKKVLDAGCGTGYFTNLLCNRGGKIYGCDISEKMIGIASENNTQNGINYEVCDMTKTNYKNNFFDRVVSVGAIFHLDQKEYSDFIRESNRILKKGGELVYSIEHPFLFTKNSPTLNNKKIWAKHRPLKKLKEYNISQKFEEIYFKKDGSNFTSILWHHPLEFLINKITENNFVITEIKEIIIEKEDLISKFWGTEYGYPAFLQIKSKKIK